MTVTTARGALLSFSNTGWCRKNNVSFPDFLVQAGVSAPHPTSISAQVLMYVRELHHSVHVCTFFFHYSN